MNYTQYVDQLKNLMAVNASNLVEFNIFLPGCISYAEGRIYRELDLLSTLHTDTSSCAQNQRTYDLPSSGGLEFITVQNVNVINPAGTRNPLVAVSLAVVDLLWPAAASNTGVPQLFAMSDNNTIVLGPSPNQNYDIEVRGTKRPASLSVSNTTTPITSYIPDLMIAASMVFASGYMRNFGSQGNNPEMSTSWEGQYQTLKGSAEVEQFRAKFQSQGWYSQKPTPANPPRG